MNKVEIANLAYCHALGDLLWARNHLLPYHWYGDTKLARESVTRWDKCVVEGVPCSMTRTLFVLPCTITSSSLRLPPTSVILLS